MAIEIERKFTLRNKGWMAAVESSQRLRQGYLVTGLEPGQLSSVRVRIADQQASLNIKSVTTGRARDEFEYSIPLAEAEYMLAQLCLPHIVKKTRHIVQHHGQRWEVDIFEDLNQGLEIAEIELTSVDAQFERPDWIALEVTDDIRYYNHYLVAQPYSEWHDI